MNPDNTRVWRLVIEIEEDASFNEEVVRDTVMMKLNAGEYTEIAKIISAGPPPQPLPIGCSDRYRLVDEMAEELMVQWARGNKAAVYHSLLNLSPPTALAIVGRIGAIYPSLGAYLLERV